MRLTEPFLFRPRESRTGPFPVQPGTPLTVAQSIEIIRESRDKLQAFDDFDLDVNPHHESPGIDVLAVQIAELRSHPMEGDAFLLFRSLEEALISAQLGRYGVGAVVVDVRGAAVEVFARGQNVRIPGHEYEFVGGHAEQQALLNATEHLQKHGPLRTRFGVNLGPCPGCMAGLIDSHIPEVVMGTPDPRTGVAFLRGQDLEFAAGIARVQVKEKRGLQYRFAEVPDPHLHNVLSDLSWEIFHTTRKTVHRRVHGGELKE
jgi:tRNA(Arg) A34 adenosine deaminase TadA